MKAHFKFLLLVVFAIIISESGLKLSAQSAEQMQKFKDEKVAFFNEKLNLSDAEAKKFWPVHEDFNNRNMKINEDERSLLNYYNCNSDAMSDKEVDETITKFFDLQKKRLELSLQYHDTFVKIIGKKKTMKMYTLEREFRMHVLKKFRSGGDNGHRGGGGEGGGPFPDIP